MNEPKDEQSQVQGSWVRTRNAMGWMLFVFATLWAVARVGPGTIPGISGAAENAFGWPTNDLTEYSAFVANSPIGSIMVTVLGWSSPLQFLVLHIIAVVIAISLVLTWTVTMTTGNLRLSAMRMVVLSPWFAMLVIFLGSYDPFTIIGFALVLFAWSSKKVVYVALAGAYLGFQHFEQGLVAVLSALLVAAALAEKLPEGYVSRVKAGVTFAALVAGKLILTITLLLAAPSGAFGRSAFWSFEWFRISVVTSINFWPVLLLSLFAGSWGLITYVFLQLNSKQRVLISIAFMVCLVPAILTLDHTRVFVIASMMSLSIITVASFNSGSVEIKGNRMWIEAMAWLIVPVSVWASMDGTPYLHPVGALDQFIIFVNQLANF